MDNMYQIILQVSRPSLFNKLFMLWFYTQEIPFFTFAALEPIKHIRPDAYWEDWLPQYIEYDFFQLFRMSHSSFEKLLAKIGRLLDIPFTGGERPILPEKRLLMSLWWLGRGEVLMSVSDKFNVTLSAVHKSIKLVLDNILNLLPQYISWPKENEMPAVINAFQERGNIPGTIGAIDVCNIPFKAPSQQQDSYTDRKMQHSIKLQAICTTNKIFTHILAGWPGSVHDSRILQNCEIYNKVIHNRERHKYFPTLEHHLVGDSAYPLLDWMLTPYRDNGNLTLRQRRYNYLHSRTRIVIEHTFGILKSRWRILKYINVNSVKKAVKVITACSILHNFCLVTGDVWEEHENEEENGDDHCNEIIRENNFAYNKRDRIAEML